MPTVTNIGRPTELQEIHARIDELQGRLFQAQGLALLIADSATAEQTAESEPIAHSARLLAEVIEEVALNLDRTNLRKAASERMARTAKDAEGGAA